MKYFKVEEFRCKCCGKIASVENTEALVENVLDPARERLGSEVMISSGTRCERHNSAVGGVRGSQHLRSEAADCYCRDNRRLAMVIVEQGRFDQLIIYPTFVHVSWKRAGGNRHQVLKKVGTRYVPVDIRSFSGAENEPRDIHPNQAFPYMGRM